MKNLFIVLLITFSLNSYSQESYQVSPLVWKFEKNDYSGYIVLSSEVIRENELFPINVLKDSLDWNIDFLLLNAIQEDYVQSKVASIKMSNGVDYTEYYSEEQLKIVVQVMNSMQGVDNVDRAFMQLKQFPPILLRGIMELYLYDIGNQHTFIDMELTARNAGIKIIPYVAYKWELENLSLEPNVEIDSLFNIYKQRDEIKKRVEKERLAYRSGEIEDWEIASLSPEVVEDIKSATQLLAEYIEKGVVTVLASPNYMFHESGFYQWLVNNEFDLTRIEFN